MSYPPDEHPQLRVSAPGDGDRVMATVLDEMGALVRTQPGPTAPTVEVAGWYVRKAAMLRHVAAEGGLGAEQAARWAVLAEVHAARLVGGSARQRKGSVSWLVLGEVA